MRLVSAVLAYTVVLLVLPLTLHAQSAQPAPSVVVPRLINVSGVYQPADGQPAGGVESVTLSIYTEPEGGSPLWQETQSVAIDAIGRYTLLLGATQADGIPSIVFASGEAQWLGTQFTRTGDVEGPRVRIASVPYALRAADADTLGGLPASAYVLAPTAAAREGDASSVSNAASSEVTPQVVLPGTTNFLAKYVNAADVGNSAVFENAGRVGIGTDNPFDLMHVRYTNDFGGLTGYAVQNLSGAANAYSGMLFYDQTGALGQFQGFNNSTHEYRINNIARVSQPAGAFNGSINFMIGHTSRFFVNSTGNVGIGTTNPSGQLEVSNGFSATNAALLNVSSFSASSFGSSLTGRKARGTAAAPAPPQNNDLLLLLDGRGYTGSGYCCGGASIAMRTAENFSATAQGSIINFSTTPLGSASQVLGMTLNPFGNLGIGVYWAQGALEVQRNGDADIITTAFGPGDPKFMGRKAGGTQAAPTAVQGGDSLVELLGTGYDGTTFVDERGGMAVIAAEDWTNTAQGTALLWGNTPLGGDEINLTMAMLPNGNLGIGTPTDVNNFPTATDRLQVFGDIRVGTSGTNGCVKNFAGTGILGTCASDRRFKKDITPFASVLGQLTALQPVHYFWRADEFPARHFGDAQAYGLIAQEVEQVLPELVVTGDDGFKAVDYSKLPLLTIQAVKELKAENDALKQRLTDLERLVAEILATTSRR